MAKTHVSDKELMRAIGIDSNTLKRFKAVREGTIKEAKELQKKIGNKKIKVLGISGSARDQFDMAQESSNSEELLERCLRYCKTLGAETELIKLRKYDIKYCKACYSTVNTQCHFYCSCYPKGTAQGDDMSNVLYDKILEADVIIFATPVNNFKISTLMATFLDRCISLDGSLKPADPKAPKNKALNIKHMKFVELTADADIPGSGMLRRFQGKVAGIITTGHEEGASMAISSLFMTLNHFGMTFPPFSTVYAMASVCNSTYKDKSMLRHGCYEDELKALAKNIMASANGAKKSKSIWSYDPRIN
jgi:multimeric flavodoxin WrbA